MQTVAQFVSAGIATPADLQAALQLAMQLEFSTIPPYLCAQWSINGGNDGSGDPNDVEGMIGDIVVQEMYHFALAGNMLSAIGGTPSIANPSFVPAYPTHVLPGDIAQKLAVDLLPLSDNQLEVFMQIEYPEFQPVGLSLLAQGPATIGDFYDTISRGFTTVNPTILPKANFVNMGEAVQITSIADALAAIARIKGEGEGTPGSPDQPPADGTQLAHYYVFKEILLGKTFVQSAGQWSFTDPAIKFPNVLNFSQSTITPSPSIAFNQALSQLLSGLQTCWTSGQQPSIHAMRILQGLGQGLIRQGIRPEFLWSA